MQKDFNEWNKIKIDLENYVNFKTSAFEYSVLLSQTKVMSAKRLIRKINKLSRGRFNTVKDSYKKLLSL